MELELELGLALRAGYCFSEAHEPYRATASSHSSKKRLSQEASESPSSPRRTLPLLRWDHKQPDEDDEESRNGIFGRNCSTAFDHNKDELVGWPPVKRWRKRTNGRNRYNPTAVGKNRTAENGCSACIRKSSYVKVKMEGVTIARKIDLGSFLSFEALTVTLFSMFDCGNSSSYRLIYRDREGDWLVAGDVPWREFFRTARLLKLQRING